MSTEQAHTCPCCRKKFTLLPGKPCKECAELQEHSERIAKLLGVRQGSVEIHCHKGSPKQVHVHDKSIKFGDDKQNGAS